MKFLGQRAAPCVHLQRGMRRVMTCTGALVLAAGCSSPDTAFCGARPVVAPSSSSEPGTLQYGVQLSADNFIVPFLVPLMDAPVAARSDGRVVCATCNGIVAFDAALHETGRVDLGHQGSQFVANLAVAPDDTVYAVVPGALIRIDDLAQVSAASEARWRAPVADVEVLVAGTEGPYVGPGIDVAIGMPPRDFTIRGFDAMTGQPRTVASGQYLLAAARGGGVFTVQQQGKQSATLRRLDPAGTQVWSRTITSTVDGVLIHGAAAAADGGVSVFGQTNSALDFGDRTFPFMGHWFVAGFDGSGATLWAFPGVSTITHLAMTAQGTVLIAGQVSQLLVHNIDATLSVATPAGISRTLHITGPVNQMIDGLAAAPDGSAWIYVSNFVDDDYLPDPVIEIGDHRFAGPGSYLFKIVP
jgi:outer membrane protein assembly factor BamB